MTTRYGRVLLVNPPIVDLRVPWAEWLQPTGLLRVGSALRGCGCEVRLLDCFSGSSKRRELQARIERGGRLLNRWRYGMSKGAILSALRDFESDGWVPDAVYVTTLTSFWWIGVPFVVELARQIFPSTEVIVGGKYAEIAPDHASEHSGGNVVDGYASAPWTSQVNYQPPALELGTARTSHFNVADVAKVGLDGTLDSIAAAVRRGATRLLLADVRLATEYPTLLEDLLSKLAAVHSNTRLFVLGSVSAAELAAKPDLALHLREARCRQLILADNRDYPTGPNGERSFLAEVAEATLAAQRAGFRVGRDEYGIQVSVGRPGESANATATLIPRLAHLAGSVIPVPYQPTSEELSVEDPWESNGKLFPFAELNGDTFIDYMELLGLCSIANAKYRSRTFDFMQANSLIARSVRRSLRSRSWDPSPGPSLDLPVIAESPDGT